MSIAANRAERQQMRQRGAANRKVKDVNFGFSFGSPELPTQPPARVSPSPVPQPQSIPAALPKTLTPNKKLSRPTTPLSRRSSTKHVRSSTRHVADTPSRRAPGSSSRRSIPSPPSVFDIPPDVEPVERSPKRRRISFENIEEDVALNTNIPQSSLHAVETVIETTTTAVSEQGNGLLFSTARAESIKLTDDVTQVQNEVPGAAFLQSEPSRSLEPATVEEINQEDTVIEQEEQRVQGPQRRKKKSKASPFATRKTPPRQAPTESEKGSSSRNAKSRQKNTGTRQKSKEFIEQRQLSSEMDAKKSPSLPQDEKENEPPEEEASEQLVTKSLGIVDESTHISPNDQGSQEPSPEPARQSRRGRRGKRERSQHAVEEQSENLEPAQGIEEQPENAHVERTETTKGSEAQHKRKRRKHALSRNDEGNAGSRDTQKRTIPVTVHRLSNVAALETAQFEDLDIPGHEDLASQKQSQKYLNRSGINAADVLSQICSESLDKTISTLQNNIEQEQNASRRNEWKRKCKVVEEFKSELENSLFDTSELMESNFTLAARLKAEKRELHQLRHRLLTLRKEREETALRIDEVRRKHLENENERMKHESLNNSLYDLQLALDRSQKRKNATEASPFAGLEFLLRTVARDVSSTAPGAQGGLLNQVKQFNNELEKTAALLEEKRL